MENRFEKNFVKDLAQKRNKFELLEKEIKFSYSRSSGPGGQNVNKLNTKVFLKWNVLSSDAFSQEEKEILIKKFGKRIDSEGNIFIYSQESRSQKQNKEKAKEKLISLISSFLKKEKQRIPTKRTKSSQEKRILNKKLISQKKKLRQKVKDY